MPPMGHGEISLDVRGVIDACQRTINLIDKQVRRALRHSAGVVAVSARKQHSYQDRTGHLTSSIGYGVPEGGTTVNVDVTATMPYADAIERGAKPHVIKPKKPGGRLVFGTVSGLVFAKQVNHPGNRPFRFLAEALEREQDDVFASVGTGLEAAMQEAGFEVIK